MMSETEESDSNMRMRSSGARSCMAMVLCMSAWIPQVTPGSERHTFTDDFVQFGMYGKDSDGQQLCCGDSMDLKSQHPGIGAIQNN